MPAYLIFTLAAPLASFGTVAVGERRPTWDRPSKSQIIGLIAGALGIERGEEQRQQMLARSLGLAVRVDNPGHLQTDFHTAQVPPSRRNRHFATRADELAVGNTELKTILSRREYRVGGIYTIAIWSTGDGMPPLEDVKAALERPVFAPFAGRKANALMLPMRPMLVTADLVDAAFAAFDTAQPIAVTDLWRNCRISTTADRPIFADASAVPEDRVGRIEERRDVPESRAKWRFSLRTEVLLRSAPSNGDPA